MTKYFLVPVLSLLIVASASAQNSANVRLGLGVQHLTNHLEWTIMIPALEGEYLKPINRFVSISGVLGVGLGRRHSLISSEVNNHAFLTHLDGNAFISPFGNDRKYNLKLGAGLSVMYASEWLTGTAYVESAEPLSRFRTGASMILESEWAIGSNRLFGVKTMVQSYTHQEWVGSLMFKYGWIF